VLGAQHRPQLARALEAMESCAASQRTERLLRTYCEHHEQLESLLHVSDVHANSDGTPLSVDALDQGAAVTTLLASWQALGATNALHLLRNVRSLAACMAALQDTSLPSARMEQLLALAQEGENMAFICAAVSEARPWTVPVRGGATITVKTAADVMRVAALASARWASVSVRTNDEGAAAAQPDSPPLPGSPARFDVVTPPPLAQQQPAGAPDARVRTPADTVPALACRHRETMVVGTPHPLLVVAPADGATPRTASVAAGTHQSDGHGCTDSPSSSSCGTSFHTDASDHDMYESEDGGGPSAKAAAAAAAAAPKKRRRTRRVALANEATPCDSPPWFPSRDPFQLRTLGAGAAIEVNPPFVSSLLDAAAERCLHLLQCAAEAGSALTMVYITPAWRELKGRAQLLASPYARLKLALAAADHGYVDGAAHGAGRVDPYRSSPYDSELLVMQSPAAAAARPLDGQAGRELEGTLRAAFAQCVPSEAALRRQGRL
jgi:Phosphorylated CTD interacting factor 1 WW domain